MLYRNLFLWTLFMIVGALVAWQLTADAFLRDARSPYEKTVLLDTAFEQIVHEEYPDIRFVPLAKHVYLKFTRLSFDRLSSAKFLGKLEGSEIIFVYFRGHQGSADEGGGIARYYVASVDTRLLPAYREFIPYPEGTSRVKSLTDGEVVFKKSTYSAENARQAVYLFGSVFLCGIGWVWIAHIDARRRRREEREAPAGTDST